MVVLRSWTLVPCPCRVGGRGPPRWPRANCALPTPTPSPTMPLARCGASTRIDGDEPDVAMRLRTPGSSRKEDRCDGKRGRSRRRKAQYTRPIAARRDRPFHLASDFLNCLRPDVPLPRQQRRNVSKRAGAWPTVICTKKSADNPERPSALLIIRSNIN